MRPVKAWTPMQRLEKEFDAIGFFLSGHPLDEYESALESIGVQTYAAFVQASSRVGSAAASPPLSSLRASANPPKGTHLRSPCSPTRPASSRPSFSPTR